MPSNEERRQAAREKLAKQNERREQQARRRKITIGAISAAVVVALVAAGCYIWLPQGPRAPLRVGAEDRFNSLHTQCDFADRPEASTSLADNIKKAREQLAQQRGQIAAMPAEQRTAAEAQLKSTEEQITDAAKKLPALEKAAARNKTVSKPDGKDVPNTGTEQGTITTNQGAIGFELDRSKAPCNVQTFVTLISGKYFDNTSCHRQTSQESPDKKSGLFVLQCGDPSGTGGGGPLWTSPDEAPDFLASAGAAQSQMGESQNVIYPAGTIAVANANSPQQGQTNTGSSQFFLVYKDTTLPANYAVIGKVDDAGLTVLKQITAKGLKQGAYSAPPAAGEALTDGQPKQPVNIQSMALSS